MKLIRDKYLIKHLNHRSIAEGKGQRDVKSEDDAPESADDTIKIGEKDAFEDAGETFEDSGEAVTGLLGKNIVNFGDFSNKFDITCVPHYEHKNLVMGNSPIVFDGNFMVMQGGTGKTVCEYYMTPHQLGIVFHKKLLSSQPITEDANNDKDILTIIQSPNKNNDIKQGYKKIPFK